MTAPALRVVNLGLPKSGTTTLARALRLAGMSVADFRIRRRQGGDPARRGQFVGDLLYRGFYETGDPLYHLSDFEGFSEISVLRDGMNRWPQTDFALIDALRQQHPGTRFVMSTRDPWDLSNSMLRWSNLGTERLPNMDIPGLPSGFGVTTAERMRWIEGHYAHIRAIFAGREDFMEFDIDASDAPERLGVHIGRPITWWGRLNANPMHTLGTGG